MEVVYAACLWLLVCLAAGAAGAQRDCPEGCVCFPAATVECGSVDNTTWVQFWKYMPINTIEVTIEDANFGSIPKGPSHVRFNRLEKLSIRYSDVSFLEPYAFVHLPVLLELNLSHNNLTTLNASHLMPLVNLERLDLSFNYLRHLCAHTFQNVSLLEKLDLSHNELQNLTTTLFHPLKEVRLVNVSHNGLIYVHPRTFSNVSHLSVLDLRYNLLDSLHPAFFDDMSVEELFLSHNPWDCHCGIAWLVQALDTKDVFPELALIQCSSPLVFEGMEVRSLKPDLLVCEPPAFETTPENITIQYMHVGVLYCNVSSVPPASIYWLTPRGVVVHPSNRRWLPPDIHEFSQRVDFAGGPSYWEAEIEALEDGSLQLSRFRYYFSGTYTCVAGNPSGEVSAVASVDIHVQISHFMAISTLIGYTLAISTLVAGMIIGAFRYCAERHCACCKVPAKPVDTGIEVTDEEEKTNFLDEDHFRDRFADGYLYAYDHSWRSPSLSPSRQSPMKCVTPAELDADAPPHLTDDIKELLIAVGGQLRHGMESGMERVRKVQESSARHVEYVRERAQNIRENIRQQGSTLRESSTHTLRTVRHSSSEYANRMKAGVTMGMEQVKSHMQSVRELCGTGDITHTISVASVQTNVDNQERTEIIKTHTLV